MGAQREIIESNSWEHRILTPMRSVPQMSPAGMPAPELIRTSFEFITLAPIWREEVLGIEPRVVILAPLMQLPRRTILQAQTSKRLSHTSCASKHAALVPRASSIQDSIQHTYNKAAAEQSVSMTKGTQPAPAAFEDQIVAEEADAPAKLSDYIIVDKLRLVRPYYFDFKCFVKQRWEGLTLVQLFSQEFPMLTEEYYTRAFHAGRLRVEGHPNLGLNARLRSSMCIRHLIHRHEPPVLAGSVQVLRMTDDFVAVSKPACMPVHTVGQYRKNTVLGVLQAEHPELGTLYPTYRLDKPVSGLLLLARSSEVAGRMRKLLEERACSKSYLARVLGCFPSSQSLHSQATQTNHAVETSGIMVHATGVAAEGLAAAATAATAGGSEAVMPCSVAMDVGPSHNDTAAAFTAAPAAAAAAAAGCSGTGSMCTDSVMTMPGVTIEEDGWLRVSVPLTWDPRNNHATAVPPGPGPPGASASSDAKVAVTDFRLVRVAADGLSSVVECRPKTGRTHQIRVHLQYLGHAIANDTQYGGTYGPPLAFRRNQARSRSDLLGEAAAPKRPKHDTQQQQQQQLLPLLAAGQQDGTSGTCPADACQSETLPVAGHQQQEHSVALHEAQQQQQQEQQQQQQADAHDGGCAGPCHAGEQGQGTASVSHVHGDSQGQGTYTGPSSHGHASDAAAMPGPSPQAVQVQGTAPSSLVHAGSHGHASGAAMPGPSPHLVAAFGGHDPLSPGPTDKPLPDHIRELYAQDCYRVGPSEVEAVCPHCPCLVPRGYPIDLEPLWLHALAYSGPDWAFEAPPPDWGLPGFELPPQRDVWAEPA